MMQKMIPLGSVLLVALLLAALAPAARAQALVPCSITAIDARAGVVSAKVNASGAAFQFRVTDAKLLAGLHVGQAVYANFTTRQVSLDGKRMLGGIISPPQAAAPVTPRAKSTPPPASPAAVSLQNNQNIAQTKPLPTISYGTPHPITSKGGPVSELRAPRWQQRSLGGATVAHVKGVDGLEQVQGIPDGVKNLLGIHVRALPAGESDHYIINVAQAQEWIKTHPIPAHVKPADVKTGDGHSGCHVVSWHCAEESAKHAADEASRQADLVRNTAQHDWKHWGTELTNDWHELAGCLEDKTLHLDNIPVKFSITPQMDINAQTQGTTKSGFSGSISGTLGLATQVDSNMLASLDVFYIPCLPFVVRPKAMGSVGTLGVTPKLIASLKANGKFDKTFDIPPTGDPHIPIEAIPIVIAGVPVAELDISVHFEGNIEVGGQGQLTAGFEVDDPHQFAVDFICDGHGCGKGPGKAPTVNQDPPTITETYKLEGNAFVKPDIYVALEMNFDVDAATVRIGPQPYLLAQINGCGTATSTTAIRPTSTTTTTTESHALVSDLDWGMILRTEFLVAGTKEGQGWNPTLVGQSHLWFKDLWPGGSNALIAGVTSSAQLPGRAAFGNAGPSRPGKTSTFGVKMPACYPFTDSMQYTVMLPAGATGVATSQCSWRGVQGLCTGNPTKALAFTVNWPAAGTYSLTVTPTRDTPHHREFKPPTATTANVTVR